MATLTYDLAVIGRATVERELATLEKRFAQHAKKIDAMAGGNFGGSSRAGSAASSAERASQKAMRDKLRMTDQVRRMEGTLARERLAAEKSAARAQAKGHADQQRAIDRQVRSQTALGRQRIREERLVGQERARVLRSRTEFVRSTFGGGASRVVRGLAGAGQAGAAMLGLGGTALAASAVNSAVSLDERTRRLSILGRSKGENGLNPETLRRQFSQTGIAHGFSAEEVAAGVSEFTTKTGDIKTPLANQRVFATVAQASDAKLNEVFSTAADMTQKLDIKSVEDMQKAFAVLSMQGKKGSFELKAMAKEFPEVLAEASNMGVRGVEGVRDVGALMQVARQATGSDSEATTAATNFMRKLTQESGKLQAGTARGLNGKKIQVFQDNDPRRGMRNFMDIATEYIRGTEGNLQGFQEVFDIRGSRAGNMLLSKFREARENVITKGGSNKEGTEAGIVAMKAFWDSFRNVSADWSEVERDSADAMKSTSVKLTQLKEQFMEAVGSALLPELTKLIPVLSEMIPKFMALVEIIKKAVSYLAENPFKAVIAAMAISIAFEVGKAKIGSIFAQGLERIMSVGLPRSAPGLPAPEFRTTGQSIAGKLGYTGVGTSAATGATTAGTLNAIGTGLTAGITVASAIFTVGVAKFEGAEAELKDSGSMLNRIRSAGNSPADLAMVKELTLQLRDREKAARGGSWTDFITGDEEKQKNINTAANFRQEAERKLQELQLKAAEEAKKAAEEQQAAAKAQKEAAEAQKEAAVSLGGAGQNRGKKPADSTIKSDN